jgi:hypothetical protein
MAAIRVGERSFEIGTMYIDAGTRRSDDSGQTDVKAAIWARRTRQAAFVGRGREALTLVGRQGVVAKKCPRRRKPLCFYERDRETGFTGRITKRGIPAAAVGVTETARLVQLITSV